MQREDQGRERELFPLPSLCSERLIQGRCLLLLLLLSRCLLSSLSSALTLSISGFFEQRIVPFLT